MLRPENFCLVSNVSCIVRLVTVVKHAGTGGPLPTAASDALTVTAASESIWSCSVTQVPCDYVTLCSQTVLSGVSVPQALLTRGRTCQLPQLELRLNATYNGCT